MAVTQTNAPLLALHDQLAPIDARDHPRDRDRQLLRHRGDEIPSAPLLLEGEPTGPAAPFTFGDPNFTSRSLRGTAVLRWEYRPGSTMFFVWTQQRSGYDQFGDLDVRRDARALLGDRPDNVFLVKATYWLGR